MNANPQRIIAQLIPLAEPGWNACFLIDWNEETKEGTYATLPILCLGLITEFGSTTTRARPFVARTNGDIVCVDDIDYRLVCLVGPNDNARRVVEIVCRAMGNVAWKQAANMD